MFLFSNSGFLPTPEQLLGTFRRFSAFGPAYKIVKILRKISQEETIFQTEIVETGEKIERKYSFILQDPEEI